MRSEFLPFSPPAIGEAEIEAVIDTLRSGWITTGPKTKQFEERFAEFVHAGGALALSSCTAGLHTALLAAGVGRGEEVITTPMTFAASVNVIEHVGARPVLADVEPDTLNIDPAKIAQAVTARSKAIIVVHYAGHPANMDAIRRIAQDAGLLIIEDAAHAFPAKYRGRYIGSDGNPVAFSFYATKNLTTGEGGMLVGAPGLLDRARVLALHGMSRDAWQRYDKGGSHFYEVVVPGYKYNMTDIQAALGLQQLQRMEAFQKRRRAIVDAYNGAFRDCETLELPTERIDVESSWHLYVLRLRSGAVPRDLFIEELKRRNIGTSVHFIPIHVHPYYAQRYGYKPHDFPVAYTNYQRMLSLPLNPRMTDDDVADVIEAVLDVAGSKDRLVHLTN